MIRSVVVDGVDIFVVVVVVCCLTRDADGCGHCVIHMKVKKNCQGSHEFGIIKNLNVEEC